MAVGTTPTIYHSLPKELRDAGLFLTTPCDGATYQSLAGPNTDYTRIADSSMELAGTPSVLEAYHECRAAAREKLRAYTERVEPLVQYQGHLNTIIQALEHQHGIPTSRVQADCAKGVTKTSEGGPTNHVAATQTYSGDCSETAEEAWAMLLRNDTEALRHARRVVECNRAYVTLLEHHKSRLEGAGY